MAPEHIPTSNTCKWRIISLPSPHVPDMGCVWFLVVFSISWRGELGAGSRTHELVVLVLARSGSAGTFWGELWALCGHRWHSKAWTWSWTPQKCGKGHLNPSQEPVIKWKYSLGAGEEQSFKDKNELHGICGKATDTTRKRSTQPGTSSDSRKMPWSQMELWECDSKVDCWLCQWIFVWPLWHLSPSTQFSWWIAKKSSLKRLCRNEIWAANLHF